MNGDADLPHRSSSPLKRRASSMDPENDPERPRDVEMTASQGTDGDQSTQSTVQEYPRAMSVDIPEAKPVGNGSASPAKPPLLEQVKIIETLLKAAEEAPLKEGDEAFLVSKSWVDKALALRGDSKNAKSEVPLEPLGPVDNSDIIHETIKDASGEDIVLLRPGSGLESFVLFPEDAWNMVVDWYGVKQGQNPILRRAINTADPGYEPNIIYEFHPPVFRIHRLWSEVSPLAIEQSLKAKKPPAPVVVRSRKYHTQTFIKELKKYTGVPVSREIRLWSVQPIIPAKSEESQQPRAALTPPDSPGRSESANSPPGSWKSLLLDLTSFTEAADQRQKVPVEDHTIHNYNGKAALQLHSLVTDQTLVIDEKVDRYSWVSTYTAGSSSNDKAFPTRLNGVQSATASGRSSPGPLTRGRAQKKRGRSIGAVGLQNLGNTCYMNSALQCVRSVEELTKYFVTDAYAEEINKTNPLGYNGKIAMTYGNLLKEIYTEGRGSVSPRDFKTTVGRCRSTFSGWGQQDSQEFLGFLLDGLQEDLSRIKQKPYIEKPDSTDDMINNPEAIKEMADKVWDITRKRDDSVIADLFTGMYKSTLKCPECGKISITFDPFNNLTLPLPVENVWSRPVRFYPLNDTPVQIQVELPKHSAMEQVFQFLSIRTGVPANRIIGAEEFKDRFFKVYDHSSDVDEEINRNDIPTFHELEAVPTNWPGKAKAKFRSMLDIDTPLDATEWDDPRYENMVVPLLHRKPGNGRQESVAPPSFIILNREEASDLDTIRRKVLEKVATFTTWSKLNNSNEADSIDADMVFTTPSDADSSGDSKVVASSVEGEDDLVNVSMKNSGDNYQNPAQPTVLKHFNKTRPKFVNPSEFLDPELQNLFELCYFSEKSDGTLPSGWHSVDPNRDLPKLTERIPQPSIEDDDEASPESWNSSGSGNDDDSTNEESPKSEDNVPTRMMEESSDESLPSVERLGPRPSKRGPGGRKKFKGHKTYSKKGNKRRDRQMRNGKHLNQKTVVKPQPMPPAVADGGPLIRLGEGLVVDWNEDAWDTVFGGSGRNNDDQGSRTFIDVEVIPDTALQISQKRRSHRKNRGITLDECLDEFERAEVLSEQDMWYCPRCKEHRRASKKFDLWKTPDILVAHLKRFSSSGWRRDKLDVLVDFPIEGLDLTSRVIQKEEGKVEIYDLIAVDDHYGGLGGGHYTAYAKNFVDGQWYNYNDSSVSQVNDPSCAVTNAAYLLFYRRRSAAPLGGPRFEQIFEKWENSDEDEDEDDDGWGKGRHLGSASQPQAGRGAARATVTQLSGLDSDEDLPSYEAASANEPLRNSIEDEGVGMADGYEPLDPRPINMTQGWSFSGIGDNTAGDAGCASDDAQVDSADERLSQTASDSDVDMMATAPEMQEADIMEPPAPGEAAQLALADIQNASWTQEKLITVPAGAASNAGSEEVAEIHLGSDKNTRTE